MTITPKTLKLKKVAKANRLPGELSAYAGRPFWCTTARIWRVDAAGTTCPWRYTVESTGELFTTDKPEGTDPSDEHVFPAGNSFSGADRTLAGALRDVLWIGRKLKAKTTNILNPSAGEFLINLNSKGSCCDPGTERYHSM